MISLVTFIPQMLNEGLLSVRNLGKKKNVKDDPVL